MTKKKETNNKNHFKIPEDVKSFLKLNFKSFKKHSKHYYDSKKELTNAYYAQYLDYMPEVIKLLVNYGHLNDVKETKEKIYEKITDEKFVKYLKKVIKNDESFDNMELLPNVIYEIILISNKQAEEENKENPDQTVSYDFSDLVEVSRLILKKKIKKMEKLGIDDAVAFDTLSVIPTTTILKKSQYFRIRQLFNVIYGHAKDKEIKFDKLIKVILKDDKDYISSIIAFALLERKEKIVNFTDTQKRLFNDITEWCFTSMEDMKSKDIQRILQAYVDSRKKDEAQNKDTNRRYYISSLPSTDYPNIINVVTKMCDANEDMKKYF